MSNKERFFVYVSVQCKCGALFCRIADSDNECEHMTCSTPDCEMYGKKFHCPVIELHEIELMEIEEENEPK